MKTLKTSVMLIAFCLMAAAVFLIFGSHSQTAHAVPTSSFNPGRVIDDGIFFNSNSMTTGEIQAFLNSKVPVCDTNGTQPYAGTTRAAYSTSRGNPPPFICLKNYSQAIPSQAADSFCAGGLTAATLTAAQIIAAVSNACSINPQVLIVLLQKEQGLVTDDWPWNIQYRSATGYGCPDTAPCDADYYGFFNQVYNAAHQFQRYVKQPQLFNYRANGTFYIPYNPSASCGGSNVYIQNAATAALYNYTPYQPNAGALAAGYGTASCGAYGNRNFWLYFNDWFGSTYMPTAFKSSNSPIYLYVSGYKVEVQAMGVLQDFGVSPQSIQTLSQSSVDLIPTPDQASGISPVLTPLIKSTSDSDEDGASLYLVSIYSRYPFASMQQFADFGFSESNISYLPLGFLESIPGSKVLSNFIYTPQNVSFRALAGQKRIIFDYPTYSSLNPSDNATRVSYYTADLIPSGAPLASRDILIKYSTGDDVYLYLNNNYYSVPTLDVYNCWGFEGSVATPIFRLANNNYISPIAASYPLSCLVGNSNSPNLMSKNARYTPAGNGITGPRNDNADVISLSNRMPGTDSLKQYIKSNTSAGVWYLINGGRKLVPTLANFDLLGLNPSQLDVVDSSVLSSIPVSGIKLGNGKSVKTDNSDAVFVISGNSRIQYSTSDGFLAYGNSWDDIETYSAATLDAAYPYSGSNVGRYYLDGGSSKVYLVDKYGCYYLDSPTVASFGSPTTNSYVFPRFNPSSCQNGSVYVKQNDQSAVYLISNGQKRAFATWNALVNYSNSSNPRIITLSQSTMATFTDGPVIN
ncbi:hypothetical protein KW801_00800 [Candidatus Saccharibacteria bacterium]|nr:hypothetical protein [Candidatus Saccharibacteria bacterium]